MSWDVILQSEKIAPTYSELENDEFKSYLGQRDEIIKVIENVFRDVDFTDKSWGMLDRDDYSIEFNMGGDNISIDSIMLHVRGEDNSIDAIEKLCESTGWFALDTSTMEFIDFSDKKEIGFNEWKKCQDKVINHLESNGDKVLKNVKVNLNKKKWWQFWKR